MADIRLHDKHRSILDALRACHESSGCTTNELRQLLHPNSSRRWAHQEAGATLAWLRELEAAGLVRRGDDQKPILWQAAPTETPR